MKTDTELTEEILAFVNSYVERGQKCPAEELLQFLQAKVEEQDQFLAEITAQAQAEKIKGYGFH